MGELSPERQRRFEEVLALARGGLRHAFQELIEPIDQVLRFHARRRMERCLRGKISDSDLCQLTYLKAFENLSEFQGNTVEGFRNWVLGILDHVRQKEYQAYHRQARDVSREVPLQKVEKKLVTGPIPAGEDERACRYEAAWRELPHRYRQVVHWHYHEKCSHKEIGQRLGMSPDAARHLFHRAMMKLSEDAHKHDKE